MERAGVLIAFEGLDQSGKQTQAEALAAWMREHGWRVQTASFPDYATPIGSEIGAALAGRREYGAELMQLLYVANRHEWKPAITLGLARGDAIVCDRYVASSVAYGEAHGLDPSWLEDIQRYLPPPDLTILLDISPATAVERKAAGRDRFERDLALLARVRESYRRQAKQPGWVALDGERPKAAVAAEVIAIVSKRFAPPSTPAPPAPPQP